MIASNSPASPFYGSYGPVGPGGTVTATAALLTPRKAFLASYSAYAIAITLCGVTTAPFEDDRLPSCVSLALDLSLAYGLVSACFLAMMVVLSEALSPGYEASLSLFQPVETDDGGANQGADCGNLFVMWDLAVGTTESAKQTAPVEPDDLVDVSIGYGSTSQNPPRPVVGMEADVPSNPYASSASAGGSRSSTTDGDVGRDVSRAHGLYYWSLLLSSLGVTASSLWALDLRAFGAYPSCVT